MGLSLVSYKDSDEESDDVVEVSGPITPFGSKKRRAMKLKALFTRGHPSGQALQLFFYFPCCPSPLVSIKGRGGQPSQGLTNRTPILRDLGSTPSPDQFVNPTTNNPSTRTRQLDTGRRVLLLRGPNQYKSRCLLR
jgi:hypothetical protein